MKKVFILIPSLVPTGPIKGAVALANFLVKKTSVTLVAVKDGPGCSAYIDSTVKYHCLNNSRLGLVGKVIELRRMLREAGGLTKVASVSYCFSADLVNIFCSKYALTCSSVRGNLTNIYKMDHGWIGLPAAIIHLMSLTCFAKVIAMSLPMAQQIKFYSRKDCYIVGNFVDEAPLEGLRKTEFNTKDTVKRFVFVGNISAHKNPLLLIQALNKMHNCGYHVALDLIGEGPLMNDLVNLIEQLNLQSIVTVHGHLADPFQIIAEADIFVLPSKSEGISRASLEALYLGLPVILRAIDGNSELVEDGNNGVLFEDDNKLHSAMISALSIISKDRNPKELLPKFYSQSHCGEEFFDVIEGND